jgi:hypothetical protein
METALREIILQRDLIPELEFRIRELEQLGFPNCQNVVEARGQLKRIAYDRYKHKYPTYLFFTDEQFNEIVKRNKLVISTCETYTGYIPDDCIEAIRNENIDINDRRENIYSIKIESDTSSNKNYFESNSVPESVYMKLKWAGKKEIIHFVATVTGKSHFDVEWELCRTGYSHLTNELPSSAKLFIHGSLKEKNSELHIAAPRTMIDNSKKKPSFFEKITIMPEKKYIDPIVFRYVKDGILVITFWK